MALPPLPLLRHAAQRLPEAHNCIDQRNTPTNPPLQRRPPLSNGSRQTRITYSFSSK
jgi:hypothetical protein